MKSEPTIPPSDDVFDRLRQQQKAIALAEQTVRERCEEMGRLLNDHKNKYQSTHGHCLAELEVLRMGNECLQQLVVERDQQLTELTQRLAAAGQGEAATENPNETALASSERAELQILRRQLQEQEALIEELRSRETPASSLAGVDDRDYEAELTEFRRELETDRQELNEEIQQLRARNAELNEAAREAELELSRERAQLARERSQLDRMREEIRQEAERSQRDAGVRERLVGVDKLKQEVAEKHRPLDPAAPVPSGSALARWRSLLSG
jgi:hypothetical protein